MIRLRKITFSLIILSNHQTQLGVLTAHRDRNLRIYIFFLWLKSEKNKYCNR